MIRLVEERLYPQLVEVCRKYPLYGNLILVNWECFREDWNTCSVWIGEDGKGTPQYALCRMGDFYRMAGQDSQDSLIDVQELAEFLRLQPSGDIQGNQAVMARLNQYLKKEPYSSITMLNRGEPDGRPLPYEAAFDAIRPCESLTGLHKMVCLGYEYFREHVEQESWVSSLFAQKRKGCARPYERIVDGKPVCSGILTLAQDSADASIGTVCTVPEYQGKGLASEMVRFLCREAALLGKPVSLDCGEEALGRFYGRLGFEVIQNWTVLEGSSNENK